MIHLVASDLDETLLRSDKHVGLYTQEMIRKIQEQGIHFVCATGRPFFSIQNTLREIGQFQKPGTYTISLNGGCVTENSTGQVLYTKPMNFDLVNQIYTLGKTYDVGIQVYLVDKTYAYRLNEDERHFLKGRMEVSEIDAEDLSFLKNQPIIKILFENTDLSILKQIEKQLPETISQNCDLSYSSNRYFEFNPRGVHKGLGLEYLCDHLKIAIKDTLAIGDNINDLGLLKTAGLSIGVKNAHPDILSTIDDLCPYTLDEDAVGHILQRYILSK